MPPHASHLRKMQSTTAPSKRVRKKTILIDALAFHPTDGGFARVIIDLLKACEAIVECEFIVAHHPRHRALFQTGKIRSVAVPFPYRLRFFISFLVLPVLARALQVDAVHCECTALPFLAGARTSMTVHDLFCLAPENRKPRTLKAAAMHWYWTVLHTRSLSRADRVRAVSRATADDLGLIGRAKPPVTVIYPVACRNERVAAARCTLTLGTGPLRLVSLGSVVPRRNLPFLLAALQKCRADWRLDVIGAMASPSEEYARFMQDDRVTFHGYVDDETRDAILGSAHLVVCPSKCEGFSFPIADAIASGIPVLTADIPVFREYVDDGNRFSLATDSQLVSMLDSLDAPAYEALHAAARGRANLFSMERHRDALRRYFTAL